MAPSHDKKLLVQLFAGLLILGALLFSVSHFGEFEHFLGLLGKIDMLWVATALFLQLGTYFALALLWQQAFRFSSIRYPLSRLLPLAVAKLFADQALPTGGISGIAFVMNAFKKREVSGSSGMGVMLIGILSYYAAYLLVAFVSLGILWVRRDANPWIVTCFAVFIIIAVAIPASILLLKRWGGKEPPSWILRIPAAEGLLKVYSKAPDSILRNPALLMITTFLQTVIFMLDAATLWAMLLALGEQVSPAVAFASFVFSSIVAMLSLIPLGLGSFEATSVALLAMSGVRLETAFAATLLLRGFTLWLPLVPGLLLTRKWLK